MSEALADVVVPTLGRPSLGRLLGALAAAAGPLPGRIVLVDDRARARAPLAPDVPERLRDRLDVIRGAARGPAAARNGGWRATRAPWVAFLDDDVVPAHDWLARLHDDLAGADAAVGGSQGRIVVPLPADRPPTDWERNVRGLKDARWATADMAYRRRVLDAVGGFDERFRRAYREDADLALRVRAAGFRLVRGTRTVAHPVRPAGPWVSVRLQAGNADDVLMRALHGPAWRRLAEAPPGRRTRHLATVALALASTGAAAARWPTVARAAAAGWLAATAEFAAARIAPGPRTAGEVATMLATSVAIPPVATAWWLAGLLRWRRLPRPRPRRPDAVLLDRDGTLVVDVPANRDPARVVAMPGARAALDRLRAAGIRLAVVSNQAAIGRGEVGRDDFARVNGRIEELLGPLGPWLVCAHAANDACRCRKPAPGLVLDAARALGLAPDRCAVIGDIGADVAAARAAGARGILVPTPTTRPEEVAAAPEVAPDLGAAVDLLLAGVA